MRANISQNHRLNGLNDFTDFESKELKNLCHLSNQNKSVIQTFALS